MFRKIKRANNSKLTSSDVIILECLGPNDAVAKYLEIKKYHLKEEVKDVKGKTVRKFKFPVVNFIGTLKFDKAQTVIYQFNPELSESGAFILEILRDGDIFQDVPALTEEMFKGLKDTTWVLRAYLAEGV
jgi:hypothetical protein